MHPRAVIQARGALYELSAHALQASPPEGCEALSFDEEESALAFLRSLCCETGAVIRLRALFGALQGAAIARHDDAEVLAELARLLRRGWIRVFRRRLPRLATWGDKEEELPATSAKAYHPPEDRKWRASVQDEPPPRWVVVAELLEPPRWAVTVTEVEPPVVFSAAPLDETPGANAAH